MGSQENGVQILHEKPYTGWVVVSGIYRKTVLTFHLGVYAKAFIPFCLTESEHE